jgi:DNA-directed RNA polymerase specialized sigma subunit
MGALSDSSFNLPVMTESPADRDKRLLKVWKSSYGLKKDKALDELLTNLQGPIMTAVNQFQGASMPKVTMELEAKRHAINALQNFDPNAGMSVSSYITTIVKQKLYRYVGTYNNVARIPEHHLREIGPLGEATTDLTARFGREPTVHELADHLGVSPTRITGLRRLLRKDLTEEGGGGVDQFEAFEHDPDFERASIAYYSMSDAEKHVFDYSLGAHGQPRLSTNEIASKLNLSAGRISQLKKSVADKIKPYITGAA